MDQKTTIKAITRHADGSGVLILQREDGSTFEADAPAEYFNSLDHQIGHPGPVEHQAPITKDDGTEQQLQDQPALRSITTHVVNEANDRLKIDVLDQPGPGGAPHLYRLHGFDSSSNPSCPFVRRYGTPAKHATLLFQCGAINEVGVNGLTHEALLAILADRLEGFQSGPFACRENERALQHLRMAACILKARTRRRMGYLPLGESGDEDAQLAVQIDKEPALRRLTSHVVNPANDKLVIEVLDGPGPGGASHLYRVLGFDTASNPSDPFALRYGAPAKHATLLFQCGAINEVGVNGLTHEALLAILADRLEGFQSGPFACEENERALHHLRMAAGILRDG